MRRSTHARTHVRTHARTNRAHIRRLVRALRAAAVAAGPSDETDSAAEGENTAAVAAVAGIAASWGRSVCTPREAGLRHAHAVPADAAVGRISAALVCPYPPGIPLLVPGEEITPAALSCLRQLHTAGCLVQNTTNESEQISSCQHQFL